MGDLDFEISMPGLIVKNFCDQNDIKTIEDLNRLMTNDQFRVNMLVREFVQVYLNEKT